MPREKKGFIANEIELERDVQNKLLEWKQKRHETVLQVEGPRQVGKTHEVRKFAYGNYRQVIYVNLVRDEYGFEDMLSEEDFLEQYCINAGLGEFQDDSGTILVIDEIQESREVYNAIRDIRESYSCDMIVSGSYLARTVHSKDFFQIGGYPQVVTTYLKTKSLADCMDVLENLVRTFTAESSRFFSNSTALSVFNEVYRAVMVQMAEEKKGTGRTFLEFVTDFVKESVKEPVSRNEVRAASAWLLYSGIIGYCDLCNNGDVTDVVSNRRAYFSDTGIANYISGLVTIPKDSIEGMLTETFAYTELNRLYQEAAGRKRVKGNKPCFSICGDYELDFVVVDSQDKRYGIDVKTGGNQSRSLKFYKEKGLVDQAIRALPGRGGHGEWGDTIPIYIVGTGFPYVE